MNIIAIESATTICGVALFMDNKIKDIDEVNQSQVHSQRLPIIVESMLKNHLININELDGIAISSGPGSYTGLRIGMSFAKGLAISGNINIIPVPTILAINYSIQQKGKYWIVLHSHKDYVYSQYYDSGKPLTEIIFNKFQPKNKEIIYGFNLEKLCNDFILTPPSVESVGKFALQEYENLKKDNLSQITPDYISNINI